MNNSTQSVLLRKERKSIETEMTQPADIWINRHRLRSIVVRIRGVVYCTGGFLFRVGKPQMMLSFPCTCDVPLLDLAFETVDHHCA